jgi:hypothetical protein
MFAQQSVPVSTTTDISGRYAISFEAMRDAVGGVGSIRAEQAGYETDGRYLGPSMPQEILQNLHLYRIRRIAPGESVSLTVLPDDTSCGSESEWTCRTVRIVASRAGTLTLALTSHNPQSQTGLEVIERVPPGVPFRPRCCSPNVTLEVNPGAEVVANILIEWTTKVSHSFTLTTSLLPR